MFDATVPPEMEVEERKEPKKKKYRPVLTSSSINIEEPDTQTGVGRSELIQKPDQPKKMEVMMVVSSVSTSSSRVSRVPTHE